MIDTAIPKKLDAAMGTIQCTLALAVQPNVRSDIGTRNVPTMAGGRRFSGLISPGSQGQHTYLAMSSFDINVWTQAICKVRGLLKETSEAKQRNSNG